MAKKPASPRAPAKQKVPPLIDSPDAKEIFVSEVVGAGVIGGCVSINLASHRWSVPNPGDDPEFSRVMVARLVLSGDAAIQLAQHLSKLSAQGRQPEAAAEPSAKQAKGKK